MSLFPRHLAAVPLLALTLTLAACGSDDDSSTSTGTTAAQAGTTAAPAADVPKDPEARLEAIASAMGKVKSLHFNGTLTDEDGEQTLDGDLTADGQAVFRITSPKVKAEIRVLGADTFIRADAAFYAEDSDTAEDRAATKQIADRWVKLPTASSGLDQELKALLPGTIAKCLTLTNGTLRDDGQDEVDGKAVDVIEDRGDKPGTAPGRLFSAAEGAPLPLRMLQTGPVRAGGQKRPECGVDGKESTTTRSDVRFSRFDEQVAVTAPDDAIEIPTPGEEGEATS